MPPTPHNALLPISASAQPPSGRTSPSPKREMPGLVDAASTVSELPHVNGAEQMPPQQYSNAHASPITQHANGRGQHGTPTSSHGTPSSAQKRYNEDLTMLGAYRLDYTLGKGSFAKVKAATHVVTGTKVAIKIMDKERLDKQGQLASFRREASMLRRLNHPHIVRLYEILETERYFCLVMELLPNRDLLHLIESHGHLQENVARNLIRKIISALDYLHQNGYVHRDLKPENLMFDRNMEVKLVDFGLGNKFSHNGRLSTFCGSPKYASPEIIFGNKYVGPEVDVWSAGATLYAMVSGKVPYETDDVQVLRAKMLRRELRIPSNLSDECRSLLKRMLSAEPAVRATIDEVRNHEWIAMEEGPIPPYVPTTNLRKLDGRLLELMEHMGFDRRRVIDSFRHNLCDRNTATYLLLEEKKRDRPMSDLYAALAPMFVRPPSAGQQPVSATPSLVSGADDGAVSFHELGLNRGAAGHRRHRSENPARAFAEPVSRGPMHVRRPSDDASRVLGDGFAVGANTPVPQSAPPSAPPSRRNSISRRSEDHLSLMSIDSEGFATNPPSRGEPSDASTPQQPPTPSLVAETVVAKENILRRLARNVRGRLPSLGRSRSNPQLTKEDGSELPARGSDPTPLAPLQPLSKQAAFSSTPMGIDAPNGNGSVVVPVSNFHAHRFPQSTSSNMSIDDESQQSHLAQPQGEPRKGGLASWLV